MSEASLTIPKHVLSESLNDETVVLDMSTGVYFGLSPVASRIWKLLSTGAPPSAIEVALLNEFEVEASVLASDLKALLVQLEGKKLIVRAAD